MTKKCINKDCKHGGVQQPMSSFYKRRFSADGYTALCRGCIKIQREKKAKEKDSDIIRKIFSEWT